MLIEEFKSRTGYTPSPEEYAEIERQYYDFDGDKDTFCACWLRHHANRARIAIFNALTALSRERATLGDSFTAAKAKELCAVLSTAFDWN